MATSLSAQLKKLATSEAQNLLGSRDHIQASFLYDSKEAATYDRQHFYNIGINGLQQLIRRDDRFREFEQNLFSPSSQTLQRFVQSSETNKMLDEAITKFLLRLSPYVQLREAHKAMEWMVHRYNVHLRNVDALMMCVLPYHDQEPFTRTLRLLKLDNTECAKWRWLEPVKKGEVFLARQTLITHCRATKGFLGFVCDMLSKHIEANTDESGAPSARHLQRIISFYTQTVLAVITTDEPNEAILSTLIPAITIGLKSHDLPDHMVSSYMILSQLFVQTNLNISLLESFLNVIAKNAQANLLSSAVMVIVIMFQKQEISQLSKKAFRYLSRHSSSLPQLLAGLSKEANIEPFLTPFLAILAEKALASSTGSSAVTTDSNHDDGDDDSVPPPWMSLLVDIMNMLQLEPQTVAVVVRSVLNWFKNKDSEAMDVDDEGTRSSEAFKVFRLLENRFSGILDQVIQETVTRDKSGKLGGIVKDLFELSVAVTQQDLTSDPVSCLALCLHHRHEVVRRTAVERLLQDVTLMEDKESCQSALTMRLLDDDPTVVSAVLGNPQKLWELFEDKSLLYQTLLKKLPTLTGKQGKRKTRDQVLQALSYMPEAGAPVMEVTAIVLSFLVTRDRLEVSLIESLLKSPLASWSPLLAQISKDWLPVLTQSSGDSKGDEMLPATVCMNLVDTLTSYLLKFTRNNQEIIADLYSHLNATPRPGQLLLVILLVTESLARQSQIIDFKIKLQKQLVFMLSDVSAKKHLLKPSKDVAKLGSPEMVQHTTESKVTDYMSQLATAGTIPSQIIGDLLSHLDLVPMPETLKDAKFWDQPGLTPLEDTWLRLVCMGVNFLLDLSARKCPVVAPMGRQLFETFIKVLGETKYVVRLLCLLWTADGDISGSTFQRAHVLQFSQVYFQSLSDSQISTFVNEPTPVWPCLLVLLSSQFERVRDVAFSLLDSLAKDKSADTINFVWFANNLLASRQEVSKDSQFLPQVLKNILEEDSDLGSSPPKKRRRGSSRPPPRSVALNYLLDVICSPQTSTSIKASLLCVLHRLDTAESFLPLMSLLKQLLASASESTVENPPDPGAVHHELSAGEKDVVAMLIKRFSTSVAGCVESGGDALLALLAAISCPLVGPDNRETIQMLAAARLKRKFVAGLPYLSRQAVLTQLLDVLCTSSHIDMGKCCRKAIKHMAMESSLIIDELKFVLTKSSAGTVREAKRLKHKPISELDSLPWKRVVILLEMVQSKKSVSDALLIVPFAFQVLGRVLEMENKGSGEYIKQLLLGMLNYICSRDQNIGDSSLVKGEHLNTDLIVQCIRSSDNPHTHHQALLLLSTAAKISPDLLLHNMMSVFTFMGASILRQDDSYSFHVIGRILENVIPALITACEEKSKDKPNTRLQASSQSANAGKHVQSEDMMTAVLHVFVDAIPFIPAHRKILLFDKLLSVVGADKYLWRLILLVIESVTVRSSKQSNEEPGVAVEEDEKSSGPIASSDLEFLTSLSEKFSGSQLLQCFHLALAYVLQLPEEKQAGQSLQSRKECVDLADVTSDVEIFNVSYHTAKQLRHFKFAVVFVFNRLVSSQHLVAQLAEAGPSSFLSEYQHVMETLLQFISQVTQAHDRHREESSNRFWRILLHKSHDLLDQLVSLLPDSMIIDVVLGLMNHSLPLVQRRAIELLNTKLLQYKENLSSEQVSMLLLVTAKLQSIVQLCLLTDIKTGIKDDDLVTGQTALYSLKILCRILAENNHKQFIGVLKVCVKVLSHYQHNAMVSASAMLCVAEIVSCIKAYSLEQLDKFMPLVTSQLQSEDITRHEVLLLAAVTSLQKITESIPLFLSPYLLEIIVQICNISSLIGAESHKPVVSQKVKLICTTLATVTPTRTFLPVLEKSFIALQDRMASCAECAMSMLKDHVVKMSREDLTTFSQDLLKFFFTCFDIRTTHDQLSEADLDVIEGRVIEAFVCLVFKLSEAQFKPMLLQIYSWATDEDVSRDRVLVFYRLCDSLAEKLKNLFTLFAGHMIKHAAEMLDLNNKSKNKCKYFGKGKNARRKSCRLLCYIVDCLQKTFSFDTEGFMTKERFDVVMQSLVDQLENQLGKDTVSDERVTGHVVPCLASLAAAAHDDSLWKDLNYQILLKTRHDSSKVRIWALSAVDAFHKQLGEDYMQLVPETIPFMSELMEDESDEVEKCAQKVLAAIEVSVGENLQEYF